MHLTHQKKVIVIDEVQKAPELLFFVHSLIEEKLGLQYGKRVHPQDLNGLEAFRKDYPECTPILVYMGDTKMVQKDILCIPARNFSKVSIQTSSYFRKAPSRIRVAYKVLDQHHYQ